MDFRRGLVKSLRERGAHPQRSFYFSSDSIFSWRRSLLESKEGYLTILLAFRFKRSSRSKLFSADCLLCQEYLKPTAVMQDGCNSKFYFLGRSGPTILVFLLTQSPSRRQMHNDDTDQRHGSRIPGAYSRTVTMMQATQVFSQVMEGCSNDNDSGISCDSSCCGPFPY